MSPPTNWTSVGKWPKLHMHAFVAVCLTLPQILAGWCVYILLLVLSTSSVGCVSRHADRGHHYDIRISTSGLSLPDGSTLSAITVSHSPCSGSYMPRPLIDCDHKRLSRLFYHHSDAPRGLKAPVRPAHTTHGPLTSGNQRGIGRRIGAILSYLRTPTCIYKHSCV